jgi:DNA invertase Pin-like site-specific DNA recombinase
VTSAPGRKAAVWIRVSTTSQDAANQLPEIERFCAHHGYDVVERYEVSESAWNGGRDGGAYQQTLKRAQDDAWAGRFTFLIVWSLDRISRGGAEDVLRIVRTFRERRCSLVSIRESWLNGSPEIQDVLISFAGWMAQQESKRRSERIRAAITAKKLAGTWTGRGADHRKRRTSGYFAREQRRRESQS